MAAGLAIDWRELSLEQRTREYSPSSRVEDLDTLLEAYASCSVAARATHSHTELAYGPDPRQRIDLFAAGGHDAPLLVFVHGGYWQQLGKHDASFPALQLVPRGIAYAAVGYRLAPDASLGQIIDDCGSAVALLRARARSLGVDPQRVVLAGSSAGAHLVAMLLATQRDRPRGAVLLSGIYDLEPLVGTYVNDALGLDAATARALSPMDAAGSEPPSLVAWAQQDTEQFKAQSRAYARGARLREELKVAGRNHFDIVYDLADPGTALGRRVLDLLEGS